MLDFVLIGSVAFGASLLTFFSGFGLGTLLLPAFAVLFPVEAAVMMTAVVHLLNNLFKLTLIWRHIDRQVALRFGLPALLAAFAGAALLVRLAELGELIRYQAFGSEQVIRWPGLVIGAIIAAFAVRELLGGSKGQGLPPRWLPLGGALSGFLGGLSGHQGALRSAFLIRLGLSKEAFIATGVVVACCVDLSRLSHYLPAWRSLAHEAPIGLMATAVGCAFGGALIGRRLLHKVSLQAVHRVVGGLLLASGLGLAAGLI